MKIKYIKVANENNTIFKNGFYINKHNEKVDIKRDLDYILNHTTLLIRQPINSNKDVINNFKVKDNIIPIGTIDCIIKLRNEGIEGNIIALNFASATCPGGGYLNGSTAQEESLCRGSLLYPSLITQNIFYKNHKRNYTPMYSDSMIYSENVPIIRNDNCELLDKPIYSSFITSAAVNKKVAKTRFIKDKRINETMDIRIGKIINLAMKNNPSAIVLGNFGCGVFGNDVNIVHKLFEKHINTTVPKEVKVIYAIRKSM